MNYKQTYQSVIFEIDDLKRHLESIAKSDQTNNIDHDLALDKIRRIYESLLSLNGDIHQKKTEKPVENKSIEVEKKEGSEPVEDHSTAVKKENISTPEKEKHKEDKKVIEDVQEAKKDEDDQSKSLSDLYAGNATSSLNDNMALKNVMDLASKIKAKPIEDIPASIGLNDKFQYIKELFDGDSNLYNKTIKRLNEAGDLDNAYTIITQEFNWDLDNDLAQNLVSLVHRKYARNNE